MNYQSNDIEDYLVYLVNYGKHNTYHVKRKIGTIVANTKNSLSWDTLSGGSIPISGGDYIGIYVEDPNENSSRPPKIILDATIYFYLLP